MPNRTLLDLMETGAEKYADNILIWEKIGESYEGATYREIRDLAHRFAAGLLSLGIGRGDRVGLISEGRNHWLIAELGILYAGAINVPLSAKLEESSEIRFRLSHAGCRMVIVSRSHAHKVAEIKNDLPELELVIHLDPPGEMEEDETSIDEVMERGEEYLSLMPEDFERVWRSVEEDDPATITYTSGTTADPKGIILTHRNYTANVDQGNSMIDVPEWWCTLLILPWDHSFGHTVGIYCCMLNGASIASIQTGATQMETLKNIPVNIREVRPTYLLSVPALAQNLQRNIEKGVSQKGAVAEKLFRLALKTAYVYNADGWNRGKGLRILLKPLYALFDKILFSKVRENLGGRLELFFGGAALLDIELQRFFYAIGIPMYQGYGLSETSPIVSVNVPDSHKLGSSGRIVPDLQIRICDEEGNELPVGEKGEIVVKGENVMAGYWGNEEATREAIREGWLYTGDIGYVDDDGYLYVLGREKSLLISDDGEKWSPEGIEEALMSNSDYIEQVMLHNSQSPYTVALIAPCKEKLMKWLGQKGLSYGTEEGQKAVIGLLQSEIDQFRGKGRFAGTFPGKWLPTTFAVLGEGFTEENRMLNTTLKMVRGRITEYYSDRLEYLYTSEGKDILNRQNMTIISRLDE